MKINPQLLNELTALKLSSLEMRNLLAEIGIEAAPIEGETSLEVEITPNRPDWLSYYGLAREIRAKLKNAVFNPVAAPALKLEGPPDSYRVLIENPSDCRRYSFCLLRGVRVGQPGPTVRRLLDLTGQNSINNLVDLANLVMLLCNQPLHVFDLDRLQGDTISVRRARSAEALTLLDGSRPGLDAAKPIVIADGRGPVALAGIMGGLESAVSADTRNVLVESAHFSALETRKSCRKLNLVTDASYRFERGADPGVTPEALALFVHLLRADQAEGFRISQVADCLGEPLQPRYVALDAAFPGRLAGLEIPAAEIESILTGLGFRLENTETGWRVEIPSFRNDVEGPHDLAEEVIRIYGYDRVPLTLPAVNAPVFSGQRPRDFKHRLDQFLSDQGFFEVVNYVFQDPVDNENFGRGRVSLRNPFGREMSVMRNSLLAGLLRNAALNLRHGVERLMLFERGRVFSEQQGQVIETEQLALLAGGKTIADNWLIPARPLDYFSGKSFLSALLRRFRLNFDYSPADLPWALPGSGLILSLDGREAGTAGELRPEIRSAYAVEIPVFAACLDQEALGAALLPESFQPWKRQPFSRRDFSFFMPVEVAYADIRKSISSNRPAELESFELIDHYLPTKRQDGQPALAMRFVYRADENRTMTGEEINQIHKSLIEALTRECRLLPR